LHRGDHGEAGVLGVGIVVELAAADLNLEDQRRLIERVGPGIGRGRGRERYAAARRSIAERLDVEGEAVAAVLEVGDGVAALGRAAVHEAVGPTAADQRVGPCPADDDVVACLAAEDVVAETAFQHVVAGAAEELIGAVAAVQGIVSGIALERVVARLAGKRVVVGAAQELIGALAAEEGVAAVLAPQGVRPGTAIEGVVAEAALELVIAGIAKQHIVAGAAEQAVVARESAQGVVAAQAVDDVARHEEIIGSGAQITRVHEIDDDGGHHVVRATHIPLRPDRDHPRGVLMIVDDITDLIRERERREETMRQLVGTLLALVGRADPFSANQSERVAEVAAAIAGEMELPEAEVRTVEIAGTLMNLGKTLVPPDLLTREGGLTEGELRRVREAILTSADLLDGIDFDGPVVETIRQVLERWDGYGRPRGLKSMDILLSARVLAVANAFVGMVSARAYRPGLSFDAALQEISKDVGTARSTAARFPRCSATSRTAAGAPPGRTSATRQGPRRAADGGRAPFFTCLAGRRFAILVSKG